LFERTLRDLGLHASGLRSRQKPSAAAWARFGRRDLTTQRAVAVKLLHDSAPEQSHRFVREAALLSQLAHPGIVEYIAHGVDGDVAYLCME
jgi:hypothetical protein